MVFERPCRVLDDHPGREIQTQRGINGDPSVAGGPLTLAIRSDGVFGGWDGGIDELAVYNYVLNPQQIQNHFLNTSHLTITNVALASAVVS